MKKPRLRLITSLFLLTLTPRIPAEIITDGTVGPASTLDGPNYLIGHDLGSQSGSNLYHSFDKFNVNTGESATFTGPLDINNVFGRVTGGESFIDGQISSDMPNADIYLINPRGIIFGQNATLNVPGSFYASTADQIILEDGTTFSATNPQNDPPILSAEPFSAFGFLDDDTPPAPISITGSQIQTGKTFALVGGEITINGANISGGQGIEIESAAPIRVTDSEMKVEGEGRIFFRGGELVVMNNSTIEVDSNSANSRIELDATEMQLTDSTIRLNPIGGSDAGSILIGMGHLNSLNMERTEIRTSTDGSGNAGSIQIKAANNITLEEKSKLVTATESSGDAGSIDIETGSLSLTNSSVIGTITKGAGNAGDIQIKAANSITLEDNSSLIVATESSGDAGSLAIETGSLSLTNSKILANSSGTGNAGSVQIKATNSITLSDSDLLVATQDSNGGDGGSIDIETGSLSLTNSTVLGATTGTGNAGDIQIKAANSITLVSESQLSTVTFGSGDAGSIDIETGSLSLTNSSVGGTSTGPGNAGSLQIKAANSITLVSGSKLLVGTSGSGDGGSLAIDTGSLSLTNSNILAIGKGGDIQIKAANSITLEDGSQLSTFTSGSGDGGSLAIDTGSLSLTNSNILATGKGADIQIKAANSITLEDGSQLITLTSGSADAGSVDIETGSLSLTNSSAIRAGTLGTGNVGDIQIKAANSITLEENSELKVDTLGSGDAGSIDIETGSLSLTNSAIAASTFDSGSAGKITITASEYIKIVGANSGISSISGDENEFPDATGNAGIITIGKDPSVPAPTLLLTEGGEISTASWGAGVSGEIDINIKNLEINQGGNIDSSSQGSGSSGQITITASEYINIFGEGSGIFSTSSATGNAGTITIGGETIPVPTLTVTESGQISTSTFGAGEGGEIDINVNNLEITQDGVINSSTKGVGAGGTIDINTNNLELTQGGRIDSSSDSSGHAGTITITASEYINLVGENSGIFSTSRATGNAGTITIGGETIPVPTLTVTESGQISTSTFGAGEGGEIDININNLEITQGGKIDSSSQGSGSAGKIAITATQYLQIFGNNSGIFSTARKTGNAGQINILAGGTPEDGVEIIPGSLFSASAELIPHAQGGLALENGGEISTSTSGQGDGGTITITSSKLRLNNAEITADNETADFNQAGNIIIGAHQLDMSDSSTISTSSTHADGGNILIGIRELNNNRITDSQIAATAGETGTGGNLEIRGPKYLILDSTNLKADADKGGNLTLDADVFIASTDSQVEASGVLQTPEHIDVGTISLLPNQRVDASKMIKDCLASDSEEEWSLKQVGYGESQQKKKGCNK
ncbi:hypothetical protein PN36_06065 [Candidatus Thiomargarita nelsonii]|uniref:Filamentous haemagglutinin FhaB/tRNA nuclease CdiA-like TPS domain-containing protein n=1 Tax=Candidatus Thiomargarita nelsonii TaxID=1003181 RepID=A0A4E0QSC9_9GAMM|nr:hypothetical protein PN36_06065 [Candidatus Thiomargarita nelsonii]